MEIKLKLNYPEMTDLHKAGLAGLYMTLQAFEKKNIEIEGLSWHLEPNQITLTWLTEKPKSTFDKLIKKSFWIDQEGFLRLTGLEQDSSPNLEQKHLLQTAILDSFLQFGKHRKTGSEKTLTYEVDDKSNYIKFAPLITFRHQKASEDFFDKKGNFLNSIEAKGWFYPGGSQKHEAHKNTILSEPLHIAIP
ncbi:MAG: type I-MYXAN CRISPR-associated Cas8a1/Cmx1, partial [Blastocatellia bacterium]|nr:type I-MYXAN CRISPR-associated Cas8a1/Cmx1 [Blastocatellia bacterium]